MTFIILRNVLLCSLYVTLKNWVTSLSELGNWVTDLGVVRLTFNQYDIAECPAPLFRRVSNSGVTEVPRPVWARGL